MRLSRRWGTQMWATRHDDIAVKVQAVEDTGAFECVFEEVLRGGSLEMWKSSITAKGEEVGVAQGLVTDEALRHGLRVNPRPRVRTWGTRFWFMLEPGPPALLFEVESEHFPADVDLYVEVFLLLLSLFEGGDDSPRLPGLKRNILVCLYMGCEKVR